MHYTWVLECVTHDQVHYSCTTGNVVFVSCRDIYNLVLDFLNCVLCVLSIPIWLYEYDNVYTAVMGTGVHGHVQCTTYNALFV